MLSKWRRRRTGFVGLVNLDRVVVEAFNDRIVRVVAADPGPAEPMAIDGFSRLAATGRSQQPRTFCCGRSVFAARGKGVVVLISDFMDKGGYEEALRYLIARQLDIYVLQVLSQAEIEPGRRGRPQAESMWKIKMSRK